MSSEPRWRRYLRVFGSDIDADIEEELSYKVSSESLLFRLPRLKMPRYSVTG